MESEQVQMHSIPKPEQSNNKENVILRAIVANPDRHKPLAQHPAPSSTTQSPARPTTISSDEATPTAMYTLESRFRPIPEKVLPKQAQPRLYYIDSNKAEQPRTSSPPIEKEEPEVLKNVQVAKEPPPSDFLEPKIISQPILYSIVGAKPIPVHDDQPIPVNKDTPSPILYAITGRAQQPVMNISENTAHVSSPVIDKPVTMYSLVANPNSKIIVEESIIPVPQVQEPVKQSSPPLQQSVPILYSVVGGPHLLPNMQEPIKEVPSTPPQSVPILYSVVGSPHLLPKPQEPVKEVPLLPQQSVPMLYSVVGSPHVLEKPQEPAKEVPSVPQQSSPTLYSVVGAPHVLPKPQEPVKEVPSLPQQSSPTLYSVVGAPHVLPKPQEPIKEVPSLPQQSSPTLYSVVGGPHVLPKPQEPVKEVPSLPQQSSPTLYSVVGGPHLLPKTQEPPKQVVSIPQQSSPSLYSIVGNPVLVPPITEVKTVNPTPLTKPVKVNPVQSEPILYTIVGEKQVPTNIPKANHRSVSPPKKPVNAATLHTVIGDPKVPRAMTPPHKPQPLPLQKQQQPPPLRPPQIPTLYPLVGKPHSPTRDNMNTRPKSPVRTRIPLPKIVSKRRRSPSFERQSELEETFPQLSSPKQTKPKRQGRPKEPTIPKSETIFIPLPEHERPPRRRKPQTTPWHMSPGRTHHRPYNIPLHDPLQLPDYRSPYAYHPSRPYRDETCHPASLPIVTNRSERKSRPPLSEPRPRGGRKHPYDPWMPHSLERYPSNSKSKPRSWDYENHSHTDVDDDMNEPEEFRRRPQYRTYRLRTPWVPVW